MTAMLLGGLSRLLSTTASRSVSWLLRSAESACSCLSWLLGFDSVHDWHRRRQHPAASHGCRRRSHMAVISEGPRYLFLPHRIFYVLLGRGNPLVAAVLRRIDKLEPKLTKLPPSPFSSGGGMAIARADLSQSTLAWAYGWGIFLIRFAVRPSAIRLLYEMPQEQEDVMEDEEDAQTFLEHEFHDGSFSQPVFLRPLRLPPEDTIDRALGDVAWDVDNDELTGTQRRGGLQRRFVVADPLDFVGSSRDDDDAGQSYARDTRVSAAFMTAVIFEIREGRLVLVALWDYEHRRGSRDPSSPVWKTLCVGAMTTWFWIYQIAGHYSLNHVPMGSIVARVGSSSPCWLRRLLYSCCYDVQYINETWGTPIIFEDDGKRQRTFSAHPLRHSVTLAIRKAGLLRLPVVFDGPDGFLSGRGVLEGRQEGHYARVWRRAYACFLSLTQALLEEEEQGQAAATTEAKAAFLSSCIELGAPADAKFPELLATVLCQATVTHSLFHDPPHWSHQHFQRRIIAIVTGEQVHEMMTTTTTAVAASPSSLWCLRGGGGGDGQGWGAPAAVRRWSWARRFRMLWNLDNSLTFRRLPFPGVEGFEGCSGEERRCLEAFASKWEEEVQPILHKDPWLKSHAWRVYAQGN